MPGFNFRNILVGSASRLVIPDQTIRYTGLQYVTAKNSDAPTVLRYYEPMRKKLVITNPANSPGNVVLYSKIPNNTGTNYGLNTTTNLVTITTLVPGQKWVSTVPANPILAKSDLTTVPANLVVIIDVDIWPESMLANSSEAGSMRKLSLPNQQWFSNVGIIAMGEDRKTFYAALPSDNRRIRVSSNYIDNPANATWIVNPNQVNGSQGIESVQELPNGELLIVSRGYNNMSLQKTVGWSLDPSKATLTTAFPSVAGTIINGVYNTNQFSVGNNGVVLFSDSGSQNSNNTNNGATKVYLSTDYGSNFTTILDIFDFASSRSITANGVHCHAVAYDEIWDRIWVLFGDDNGTGLSIAGAGNTQVLYSDDRGVTWQILPAPTAWVNPATGNGQRYNIAFNKNAVVFTADLSNPIAMMVHRRLGYRILGDGHPIGYSPGLNARITRTGKVGSNFGFIFPSNINQSVAAGTYNVPIFYTPDLLNFQQIMIPVTTGSTGGPQFFRAFGPTYNNKFVAIHNSATVTNNTLVCDFVY